MRKHAAHDLQLKGTQRSPMKSQGRIPNFCSGAMLAIAAGLATPSVDAQVVNTDIRQDIEVFFTQTEDSTAYPNILFILDTSQSMYTVEDTPDPTSSWTDPMWDDPSLGCTPDMYYWATQDSPTPKCGAGAVGLTATQFKCANWQLQGVDVKGFETRGPLQVAQETSSGKWATLSQASLDTVCKGDGDSPLPTGLNWSAKGKNAILSGTYTFYRGDYLNYINSAGGGRKYRIDIARETVAKVLANTQGIKAGLMRFGFDGDREYAQDTATACEVKPSPTEDSRSSNGAPVVFPVVALDGPAVAGMPLAEASDLDGGQPVLQQLRYQLGLDKKYQTMSWVVDPSKADADQPYQVVHGQGGACGGTPAIPLFAPGGRSPIGAAMHEAYLYYAGKQWSIKHGKQAAVGSTFGYPSVPQSRLSDSEIYKSPIEEECAKNFIVLISDGTTEQDNDIDGTIQGLPGFQNVIGSNKCDTDSYLNVNGNPPPSQCVDDMAEYLYETDLSSKPGLNNVITYGIGFRLDPGSSAELLLQETTKRGGGEFCNVRDAASLEECLTGFVRRILSENSSFSAPAVTVNAFNRTQNLNDLYMSLFRPRESYRWIGNIKKYQIDPVDGDIIDATGATAVDPSTGFFIDGARSLWSDVDDGSNISIGGAADEIDPATRNVYTNGNDDTNVSLFSGNDVSSISDPTVFGIQAGDLVNPGAASSPDLDADTMVKWIYGYDVADIDGDASRDEPRHDTCDADESNSQACDSGMGDPLHGKPVTVIYGGSASDLDLNNAAIFAVTNDGMLHAIKPDTGEELWSFLPGDQLGRMRDLYYDEELTPPDNPRDRGYGLDGNMRVYRIDQNRNGVIETTDGQDDKVYLFFGQRRGGSKYYALDITKKTQPRLMWTRDYASYGAGQSWSAPQPMLLRLGSDTTPTLALAFGGGYDEREDEVAWADPTGEVGNRVFIVDALDGDVIWFAGPPSAGGNLDLDEMNKPIPADIRVIDLTGDGLADRMYTADMGGRVWRFDIVNGETGDDLVEGGLFATLGIGEESVKTGSTADANNRRFFYTPDVSLITFQGKSFLNVAIGSGHRELPATDTTTQNWFYSMRDYNVFGVIDRDDYRVGSDPSCTTSPSTTGPCHDTILHADIRAELALTDVTTSLAPISGRGWKLRLSESGEKGLAESRTFQGAVYFTTYAPRIVEKTPEEKELLACAPKFGINKLYIVNAASGAPVVNLDTSVPGASDLTDRSKELAQGSIAPEPVFIFPTPQATNENPNPPAVPPICLVGLESCGTGLLNPPVRTYWRQRGAN